GWVEPDLTDLDGPAPPAEPSATQDGTDPGRELPDRERLDHVVIRPQLQAENPVDLLAAGREHDDRDVGLLPDLASQVPSVAVRQHDVKEDEVGRFSAVGGAGLLEGHRELRGKPLPCETLRERLCDRPLILDDQDPPLHAVMVPRRERPLLHVRAADVGPGRFVVLDLASVGLSQIRPRIGRGVRWQRLQRTRLGGGFFGAVRLHELNPPLSDSWNGSCSLGWECSPRLKSSEWYQQFGESCPSQPRGSRSWW